MTQIGEETRWPAELTRATGAQIRRFRSGRSPRMSADQLAAEVTAIGLPYTRAQVTNLEAGRRTSISVGEVLTFAAVLGVPPVLLMFPIGQRPDVEALPEQLLDTWQAVEWLVGDRPAPGQRTDEQWRSAAHLIGLYREHAALVREHAAAADHRNDSTTRDETRGRVERQIPLVRQSIRDRDEQPPALPPQLAHLDPESETEGAPA